ncbi:MAG: TetR/AcrR family transcriptional regulator C-terminal domain-containing protein [Selenomonadaceae bacterium]|nr:TetR/AcrR family transcriptional regulator C-terminal domain-containing protein [Selenomonadaceae bacterium]
MKLKSTREIIADSLREIGRRKKINSITIREIMENCGFSIATFYRHFKDKYDLIAWDYVRKVENLMSRCRSENQPWKKSLIDGARYFWENREFLRNLFLHTSGQDSFIHCMIETNIRELTKHIHRTAKIESLPPDEECLVRIYCYGTVLFVCEWLQQKNPISIDQAALAMENSLPEPLKKYLVE